MNFETIINHISGSKLPITLENKAGKVHMKCEVATLPNIVFSGTSEDAEIFIAGILMATRISESDYIEKE